MSHELDAEAVVRILLSDAHIGTTRHLQINDEKIELKIPAGIRDGQKLRVRGKGNYQPETGKRGDLYIAVRVLGAEYNTSTFPVVERDTTYRNSHAGTREVIGKSIDNAQPSNQSPGTYRYQGERILESFLGVDLSRDTTYRNNGAGSKENISGSRQEAKTSTNNEERPRSRNHSITHDYQEYTFWTDNAAFFYGKIAEWKDGRGKGFYAKNDIVCEVRCFTPDSRPPFTEYIRATCNMKVTERLAAQGQQISNSYPLFRFAQQTTLSSDQYKSPQSGRATSDSAQNNQIMDPIEGLDQFISMVKDGYAFQVRDVLECIVTKERERIENERLLWRLGAGVATIVSGGLIDGFGIDDLLSGMAMSKVAGMAHQFVSKEQVEFLKKLQSEWLVLDRSPMDIRRRLGEAQGRFIGISRANILDMFNIHQSGSRGFHMVELDHAGNIAKGFKDPQSLEVLQRSCGEENTEIYSHQLYPSSITPLKLCRTITPDEARKKDPYFNQLSKAGAPFRVVYSDDTEGIMYKIQIPHHSDF